MTRARGVDISSVQVSVNFARLAPAVDFLILKGTQGAKGVDSTFQPRLQAARDAGILVPFAYHVLTAQSSVDGQARHALDFIAIEDLHVALDFELPHPGLSINQRVDRALQFVEVVTSAGVKCVVYSYPDFMRALKSATSLPTLASLAEYWAAHYPHEKRAPSDDEQPWVPPAWEGRWLLWQWSGNGGSPVAGIPQVVDHNIWNGTKEDVIAWSQRPKNETFRNPPDDPA